jgi:hypothetical protein
LKFGNHLSFSPEPGAHRRSAGRGLGWEPACKPGSVVDSHSSGMRVAAHLKRPTREPVRAARRSRRLRVPLFGLAPGGVYRAAACYHRRGALLPHLFTLAAPPQIVAGHGGLFSVALSVGSRPPGVTWHPALRSPDFPPSLRSSRLGRKATARPTPTSIISVCLSAGASVFAARLTHRMAARPGLATRARVRRDRSSWRL